jgi:ribonuclease HI
MPWRRMTLRGARVLARCLPSGDLAVEGGRVEIRYRPTDARAYQAALRNLEPVEGESLLPDDHCVEAEPTPQASRRPARKKSSGKKGAPPPSEPDGDEILVYSDGACSGNPGPAGLGVVMRWSDEQWELSEYLGHATNNVAELTAILRAAERVPDPARRVRILTDSRYSIGVLTQGWKARANQALVAETKRALGTLHDVVLDHVPGHAGVPLNERADALARLAIETRESTGWVRSDRDGTG